jgi:hypothetical protein
MDCGPSRYIWPSCTALIAGGIRVNPADLRLRPALGLHHLIGGKRHVVVVYPSGEGRLAKAG